MASPVAQLVERTAVNREVSSSSLGGRADTPRRTGKPFKYDVGGCSSIGRAPALHAGGTGIETPQLHLEDDSKYV